MKKVIEYLKYSNFIPVLFWTALIGFFLAWLIALVVAACDEDYQSRKIHDGDLMITMQGDTVEIHHYKHTLYYTKVSN